MRKSKKEKKNKKIWSEVEKTSIPQKIEIKNIKQSFSRSDGHYLLLADDCWYVFRGSKLLNTLMVQRNQNIPYLWANSQSDMSLSHVV